MRVESIERNHDSKNGARNVHICTHLHKISTLMFSSTYLLAINVLWRKSKGNSLRSNAIFERGQIAFVPCHSVLELPSSSEDISVPDLPTVDRAITIQNGGRCRSETSERSKLGLRTGKERYILFITI